jgi:hypothetical protein
MRVAILTPAYDGKVVCDYAISMAELFRLSSKIDSLEINLNFRMHDALIQKSRNDLFTEAYEAGFDVIYFIDADQSFSPKAFFETLASPADVIGVPVRMKTAEDRYNIRPENIDGHQFHPELGLLEVECIGTGFLKLTRTAMDILWNASPEYRYDGKTRRMICNMDIVDGGLISEDVQICNKLKAGGLKIFANIDATCSHFGTKRFDGNYKLHYFTEQIKRESA